MKNQLAQKLKGVGEVNDGIDDPLRKSNFDRDGRVLADDARGIEGEGKDFEDFTRVESTFFDDS